VGTSNKGRMRVSGEEGEKRIDKRRGGKCL